MGKAKKSDAKRARVEVDQQLPGRGNVNTQKENKTAMTILGELLEGMDGVDEDNRVDLEYHNRLVEQSQHFRSDDEFKELLRLRFKLVANGVLKLNRSLDNLLLPSTVLEKVGELFNCLDWALSVDE